jgi:hypothetical protein
MLTPSLTALEKRVVKALLNLGERNQDIHVLVNTGRDPTVNFGRISGVKKSNIEPATDVEVARFRFERTMVDLKTGLSPFTNERLVRAREAMLLAVHVFNMPLMVFKVEVFSVLANISWTYLLHQYYDDNGVNIVNSDGNSLLLSQMIKRHDFPLSKGVAKNLEALKIIRDAVEHKILRSIGESFYAIFQATCLNFEKAICSLFGDRLSLGAELQYALQFSKMSMSQAVQLQSLETEGPLKAIDAKLNQKFTSDEMADPEFMFKVSYSLEKATKGDSHFQFANKLDDGTKPQNILVQKIAADEQWPYKPAAVVALVKEFTGKPFTSHNHTQAWRKLGARPKSKSNNPNDTKKNFCTFHVAHKDYTYSDDWVAMLCEIVNDEAKFSDLKLFKL